MLLKLTLWEEMQPYLFIDAKLSTKKAAVAAYRSVCRFLLTYFSEIEFTRPNFSTYLLKRRQKGNSPQTLDNHLKMAKHIDRYLSIVDTERKRIIEDYTFFKDKGTFEFETLTTAEVAAMITVKNYCCNKNSERDAALIALLAVTAARPMEALGLMWNDLKDVSGQYSVIYRDTKNNTDRRVPIVREDVWQMIQSLPRISKYVFPSDTNKDVHMGNPQLGVMVKRRAEAAEITKKMEPYIFRRTWLTLAVQSGMPMPDAKKIMGHKDINTTARYYNSDDAQQRKAMMLHKLNRKDVSFKTIKAMAAERLGDLTDGTSAEWSVTSEGDGYMNIRISVV